MSHVNAERLLAFEQLLAQPDPRGLRPRRHRLTQPGARDRWSSTWQRAVRTWTQARIAGVHAEGAADGWKPADTPMRRWLARRFGR